MLGIELFYFDNGPHAGHVVACDIAKETLDLAKKDLGNVDEDDEEHKDAFSIINLLQENLNMWTSDDEN